MKPSTASNYTWENVTHIKQMFIKLKLKYVLIFNQSLYKLQRGFIYVFGVTYVKREQSI